MKRLAASIIVIASIASVGSAFAQSEKTPDAVQEAIDDSTGEKHFKRGPVDLQQFSDVADLKAADASGDGVLSGEEIETMVMKRMVERMANRAERRLDVNGDGKVTIEEVEKQKHKEFAALDRNEDGKLDRKELRAAHDHGMHGKHRGHGKHHHGSMHRQ